jgi:hypothetical protein
MELTADQCDALQMLAGCPQGVTEDVIVLTHGFDIDVIASLVRSGLATAWYETVRAGGKTTEVARIGITEAGRQALKTD